MQTFFHANTFNSFATSKYDPVSNFTSIRGWKPANKRKLEAHGQHRSPEKQSLSKNKFGQNYDYYITIV